MLGVGMGGGAPPRHQGVLLGVHRKSRRLRAWPRPFPTILTFFSAGMRRGRLLRAQTYNLGLSGPLSGRIHRSTPPNTHTQRRYLHTHTFLRHIPAPGGVSPVEDPGWAEAQLLLHIVSAESEDGRRFGGSTSKYLNTSTHTYTHTHNSLTIVCVFVEL